MKNSIHLILKSLQQDINKRLSLPVDLHLPEAFVAKQNASPSLEAPLSRASRRQSLSEIGFGRLETYTKLDRLGQVRSSFHVCLFLCSRSFSLKMEVAQ
jgi:hypothetical protein